MLKEKVQKLQEERERVRAKAVEEAYRRQALAENAELRPWAAQARLEEVVDQWERDRQEKSAQAQAARDKQHEFHQNWTSAVPAPVEPSQEAREDERRSLQEELSTHWAANIVDRELHERSEQLREQQFLQKWGAFQSDQEQHERM